MRRRLLDHTYKKTVTGNPAVAKSVARMYPDISFTGFTTQDGTPSPENPVDIVNAQSPVQLELNGGQIFDASLCADYNDNGLSIKYLQDENCFLLNGTCTQSAAHMLTIINKKGKKGANYSLSAIYVSGEVSIPDGNYAVAYYGGNNELNNTINWFNVELKQEYSTEVRVLDYDYITGFWFFIDVGCSFNDYKVKLMLNVGDTSLPYEPYKQPQTVTLTPPKPLTKWDRLIRRAGVWGWLYKSNEYIVTDNETVIQNSGYFSIITKLSADIELRNEAKCNIVRNSVTPYGDNVFWIDSSGQQLRLSFTEITTVDELKEYVKNNEVKIIYAKSNVEFVPLSEEEQTMLNALHTNNPTTIVQNSIGTDVTLTYKTKRSLEVTQ